MSKVLIYAGEGAIRYVRMGYAKALAHIGHQCTFWHPKSGKPLFDIFTELEPDIVFCGGWEIDRPLFKNLMKRPHVKVILWGGNWGDFDSQIDLKEDPVLMISDMEKQVLPHLVKNNNIQHVFTYYAQRWANVTHNHWRNLGLDPVGVPLAADLVELGISSAMDELRCDASFMGGYWPYKAQNLNKYIIPMCFPGKGLHVKIFGYGGWPVAQYLGTIEDRYLPMLFASSTVNMNVFEPLASKYGFDVNERCYKILACGGFCVSEYCESAAKDIFTHGEVVFAHSPHNFQEFVKGFVAHPEERVKYIEKGIKSIKHRHNYFIRLKQVFDTIGIESEELVNTIESLKQ